MNPLNFIFLQTFRHQTLSDQIAGVLSQPVNELDDTPIIETSTANYEREETVDSNRDGSLCQPDAIRTIAGNEELFSLR